MVPCNGIVGKSWAEGDRRSSLGLPHGRDIQGADNTSYVKKRPEKGN